MVCEPPDSPPGLRVCADPNNLPFSNRQQQGFENKIAELLARERGGRVAYTWWPQRRGFLRGTLNAGRCEVVMGVPVNYELALTTRPYYGSTYAFVYPSDAAYRLTSLDDAVLASLRIGVHLIGDDYTNSPPAHALSQRGLVENVIGYSVFGNYAEDSPPGKIVEAVAAGEIDTALVWGPIAGYFAQRHTPPLQVTPLPADAGSDRLPFRYDIAMGVRRGNQTLKAELDALLVQHARPIRAILQDYGVPLVGGETEQPSARVPNSDDLLQTVQAEMPPVQAAGERGCGSLQRRPAKRGRESVYRRSDGYCRGRRVLQDAELLRLSRDAGRGRHGAEHQRCQVECRQGNGRRRHAADHGRPGQDAVL